MHVYRFIRGPDYNSCSIQVDGSDAIEDVQKLIKQKTGIGESKQVLIHQGKPLRKNTKVKDYDISSESTLHLYGTIEGGHSFCIGFMACVQLCYNIINLICKLCFAACDCCEDCDYDKV